VFIKGDHFRFGSIFIKKSNQTDLKKNRNRFKPIGFGSLLKEPFFFLDLILDLW
jgi:hypothetical protein